MQVCTSLQTNNHASTPPLSVLHVGCPSCHPTNSVKALKALKMTENAKHDETWCRFRSDLYLCVDVFWAIIAVIGFIIRMLITVVGLVSTAEVTVTTKLISLHSQINIRLVTCSNLIFFSHFINYGVLHWLQLARTTRLSTTVPCQLLYSLQFQ